MVLFSSNYYFETPQKKSFGGNNGTKGGFSLYDFPEHSPGHGKYWKSVNKSHCFFTRHKEQPYGPTTELLLGKVLVNCFWKGYEPCAYARLDNHSTCTLIPKWLPFYYYETILPLIIYTLRPFFYYKANKADRSWNFKFTLVVVTMIIVYSNEENVRRNTCFKFSVTFNESACRDILQLVKTRVFKITANHVFADPGDKKTSKKSK